MAGPSDTQSGVAGAVVGGGGAVRNAYVEGRGDVLRWFCGLRRSVGTRVLGGRAFWGGWED